MFPDYATAIDLKNYATQFAKSDDLRHEMILEPASRLIDRLTGFPDGYFGMHSAFLSERRFLADGTRYLRLDPHRSGSIEFVEYDQLNEYTPDYSEKLDSKGQHWLIARKGCEWSDGEIVVVTACWGFDQVPADIRQATIELALIMWRQRDPALQKIQTDVNGQIIEEKAIPTRVRETCAAWKKRRAFVLA